MVKLHVFVLCLFALKFVFTITRKILQGNDENDKETYADDNDNDRVEDDHDDYVKK